jgi:hypothetical protein
MGLSEIWYVVNIVLSQRNKSLYFAVPPTNMLLASEKINIVWQPARCVRIYDVRKNRGVGDVRLNGTAIGIAK